MAGLEQAEQTEGWVCLGVAAGEDQGSARAHRVPRKTSKGEVPSVGWRQGWEWEEHLEPKPQLEPILSSHSPCTSPLLTSTPGAIITTLFPDAATRLGKGDDELNKHEIGVSFASEL